MIVCARGPEALFLASGKYNSKTVSKLTRTKWGVDKDGGRLKTLERAERPPVPRKTRECAIAEAEAKEAKREASLREPLEARADGRHTFMHPERGRPLTRSSRR